MKSKNKTTVSRILAALVLAIFLITPIAHADTFVTIIAKKPRPVFTGQPVSVTVFVKQPSIVVQQQKVDVNVFVKQLQLPLQPTALGTIAFATNFRLNIQARTGPASISLRAPLVNLPSSVTGFRLSAPLRDMNRDFDP